MQFYSIIDLLCINIGKWAISNTNNQPLYAKLYNYKQLLTTLALPPRCSKQYKGLKYYYYRKFYV